MTYRLDNSYQHRRHQWRELKAAKAKEIAKLVLGNNKNKRYDAKSRTSCYNPKLITPTLLRKRVNVFCLWKGKSSCNYRNIAKLRSFLKLILWPRIGWQTQRLPDIFMQTKMPSLSTVLQEMEKNMWILVIPKLQMCLNYIYLILE